MIISTAYPRWQASRLPGFAGQLFDEITALGIHPDLALGGIIGCASLLTQGVADVEWPGGLVETIGANVLAVSPSGSGKTLMLKLLMEPVHQFLNEDPKQKFQPLIEDVTRQVVPSHLLECRFAWLSTDEAGQIRPLLEGGAPWLAKMLDARPLHRARVATGTVRLTGYRLSGLLLGQPAIFEQMCPMIRGAGGVGATNRFFVAEGGVMQPTHLTNGFQFSEATKERLALTVEGLMRLSASNAATRILDLPVVPLSRDAREYLSMLVAESHAPAARFGAVDEPSHLAEYRTRHAQRVLRLAGALHVFEHGPVGEITMPTVLAADQYGRSSMEAFNRMTYVAPKPTQVQTDAQTLLQALYRTGVQEFQIADLRRSAVVIGLTKGRFDKALAEIGSVVPIQIAKGRHGDILKIRQPHWTIPLAAAARVNQI